VVWIVVTAPQCWLRRGWLLLPRRIALLAECQVDGMKSPTIATVPTQQRTRARRASCTRRRRSRGLHRDVEIIRSSRPPGGGARETGLIERC